MIRSANISDAVEIGALEEVLVSAMQRARKAQRSWSRSSFRRRRELLRELRHLIADRSMELAEASAAQRGRTAVESLTAEVLPLLEACRFLEREMESILSPKTIGARRRAIWLQGTTSQIVREAYGVVLVIGPGNYPLFLPGVQLLQALAAGNAVLLKPGSDGTPAAEGLLAAIREAGFNDDLCILLPESVEAAVASIELRPDKVVFTGSSAVGKRILKQLADHAIPSTMELSGCDAVIIRDDADLDLTAAAIAFGLTLNDGATCMAPRRVFVNARVARDLEARLLDALRLRVNTGEYVGVSERQHTSYRLTETIITSITEAVDNGARCISGAFSRDQKPTYPLVLSNVPADATLLKQEHFASLVAIVSVNNDKQAIHLANEHHLGLGASIFTQDVAAARQIADSLVVGVVSINDLIIPTADPRLPLRGRKLSGFGATQGAEGLLEMTVPKVVSINRKKQRRAFGPIRQQDGGLIAAFARVMNVKGFRARSSAAMSLVDQLRKYNRPTKTR